MPAMWCSICHCLARSGNPSISERGLCEEGWIRGASPRMTGLAHSEASLVFCPVQDARLLAVADEFPDRRRAVVGAVLMVTRFASLGRKLVIAAVLLLVICGLSPLGKACSIRWSSAFRHGTLRGGAPDGIIVLGASIEADLSAAHGTPVVRGAPDRIIDGGGAGEALSERARGVFRRQCKPHLQRRQGSRFRRRNLRKPRRRQIAADHGTAIAQHPGERRVLEGAGHAEGRASDGCW